MEEACKITVGRLVIASFPWFGLGPGPYWQGATEGTTFNQSAWATHNISTFSLWAFQSLSPDLIVIKSDAWDLAAAWQNYYGGPRIFNEGKGARQVILSRHLDYRWFTSNPLLLQDWYGNAKELVIRVRETFPHIPVYWRTFAIPATDSKACRNIRSILRPAWIVGLLNSYQRALVEELNIGLIPWDMMTIGRAGDPEWSTDGTHYKSKPLFGYLNHLLNIVLCEAEIFL